jgi:hypothetical protein
MVVEVAGIEDEVAIEKDGVASGETVEAAIEEDEAASVEIAESEEEADGAITEGGKAAVVFEVIEAEVEVVVEVEEEGMEGRPGLLV